MEKKLLARLGDRDFSSEDVEQFIKFAELSPDKFLKDKKERDYIVHEMVNHEMLYNEAIEEKIDETEEFKRLLEDQKKKLMTNLQFLKAIKHEDIKEEDIVEYYEKYKDDFISPEKVETAHILLDTEEEAFDVLKEIVNGKDFTEAVKQYSLCPTAKSGGILKPCHRHELDPDFAKKAFSMHEGEVSEPIKTRFGYHIIKLLKKIPSRLQTLDEVREYIKYDIGKIREMEAYKNYIKELEKKYKPEYFI